MRRLLHPGESHSWRKLVSIRVGTSTEFSEVYLRILSPDSAMPRSSYRPDIDGLRALAVLSVILFHAGLFFPGGFVGVDVFFVISGYLITQIVERDLMARRFSVVVFYQRRVRRIFPALFAMFAVLTILGYLIFPPSELEDFGKTLLAASAFSSNILFFRRSGYFDPNSDLAPLLHTWTLSLEEQFYVGWPLLLVLLNPRGRRSGSSRLWCQSCSPQYC